MRHATLLEVEDIYVENILCVKGCYRRKDKKYKQIDYSRYIYDIERIDICGNNDESVDLASPLCTWFIKNVRHILRVLLFCFVVRVT